MTVLINLFGQPSCGKSSTMADLFAELKRHAENTEMCPEWVKKWAWEKKEITKYCQPYICGNVS